MSNHYTAPACASNPMGIVATHETAKQKMLDLFSMFDQQKEAILAADAAHKAGVAEYLVNRDAEKLEDQNEHYSFLLDNFKLLTESVQVAMDEYAAAKYQYLSVFPLGHADGWSFPDDEPSMLTGVTASCENQPAAVF